MKNQFLFLFLLLSKTLFSQIAIKGTVYQENGPLEGVAVYLNNTMLGTTTNVNGEFSIPVKEGQYELIISYLGFKKINYALNTVTYTKPLVFTLEENENVLDEIIIKKTIYDKEWKYNFASFKREFLGVTELAKNCVILNPETLYFEFNSKENILTTFARKPIQIKHKSLGYLITYELESFLRYKDYVTYLGYTRYQELKGNKRKKRRWKKNRLKTYNGSFTHFLKSVLNNTFKNEGYIVNQFKRVPNPERPTENEIKKAREFVRLSKASIRFSKKIDIPKNASDSALVVLRKVSLPKFKDYLYNSKLEKDDILTYRNNAYYLSFDNNLTIVYSKEKEEFGYLNRFNEQRNPLAQTSSLIPIEKNIILDTRGILVNPLAVFYEGYWSYEKFANSLPLDYEPPSTKK